MINKIKIAHHILYWIGICTTIYLYGPLAALYFVLLVLIIIAFCYLAGQSYLMGQHLLAKTNQVNKESVLIAFTLTFSILMTLHFTRVTWVFILLLVAFTFLQALFFHYGKNKVNNHKPTFIKR